MMFNTGLTHLDSEASSHIGMVFGFLQMSLEDFLSKLVWKQIELGSIYVFVGIRGNLSFIYVSLKSRRDIW